jgi:hypothetical protein
MRSDWSSSVLSLPTLRLLEVFILSGAVVSTLADTPASKPAALPVLRCLANGHVQEEVALPSGIEISKIVHFTPKVQIHIFL